MKIYIMQHSFQKKLIKKREKTKGKELSQARIQIKHRGI